MFFTRLARIAAILMLVVGIYHILLGIGVASGYIVEPEAGRYLGTKTSGQWIDRGIYTTLLSLALGALAEISRTLLRIEKRI